jgi:hypothetical protein
MKHFRRFMLFSKQSLKDVEVLTAVVMKSSIFWDITSCSPLKVNRRFGGTYRLHLHEYVLTAFRLISFSAYNSTLRMEAICSSETSVDFQRTTRRNISGDRTLQWLKHIKHIHTLLSFDVSRWCEYLSICLIRLRHVESLC